MIPSRSLDQRLVAARKYVSVVGVLFAACITSLSAQAQQLTRPKIEAKAIWGGVVFGEDNDHKTVGAAVRVYVTKRLSIEPEYLYLWHGENDQDQLFAPNVAWDFTDPRERFVVYGIAGGGVLHHKGRFVDTDFTGTTRVFDTSFTTWTASVGGGLKIFVTDRLFVSPEFRVGRQPTLRGTINVGYVFGGRSR
jgi:hypothetical protein